MSLWIALACVAVFAVNVVMGATARANFLTDVQEMIVLFAASIAFVAAILRREADAKKTKDKKIH